MRLPKFWLIAAGSLGGNAAAAVVAADSSQSVCFSLPTDADQFAPSPMQRIFPFTNRQI